MPYRLTASSMLSLTAKPSFTYLSSSIQASSGLSVTEA